VVYKPTEAAVFHLTGTRDEYYPPERVADYKKRLQLRSPSVELRSYDATHEFVPAMREDIRNWLDEHAE
jgi:predicted esterase